MGNISIHSIMVTDFIKFVKCNRPWAKRVIKKPCYFKWKEKPQGRKHWFPDVSARMCFLFRWENQNISTACVWISKLNLACFILTVSSRVTVSVCFVRFCLRICYFMHLVLCFNICCWITSWFVYLYNGLNISLCAHQFGAVES